MAKANYTTPIYTLKPETSAFGPCESRWREPTGRRYVVGRERGGGGGDRTAAPSLPTFAQKSPAP